MAVRHEQRGARRILVLDIPYTTSTGERRRYRRDAQVQTATAARAEHGRLLQVLATTGEIPLPSKEPEREVVRTFADALEYFREHVEPTLKPSTRIGYEDLLEGPHMRDFAKTPLTTFDETLAFEFDARLVKAGNGASSRRNHLIVLRSVLRAAVMAKYLDAMPMLPKLPKVGTKEPKVPTRAEIELVIDAARSHQRLALALAALAGLRAGEIRGLRRRDVDLARGLLTVRQAICRGVAAAPKSGNERVIPIASSLLCFLQKALLAEPTKEPDASICRTRSGRPWSQTGISSALRRAQARAKVGGWTLHTLRHSFVTELFRRGAGAPTVQRLAGHQSLAVTQRYSHVQVDDLRRAVATLGGNSMETTPTTL